MADWADDRAAKVADEFYRVCPAPDAAWFVEEGLKPVLSGMIAQALREAKARGFAEGVEAAAKEICWMCRGGELPWVEHGEWVHGSTQCKANVIFALIPTTAEKES
jgi:hypothetical protein